MKIFLSVACIIILVSAAFFPCLRNGFCNVDDDIYVYHNPLITDLSWRGAARIFAATDYSVLYTPLVFLTFALERHYFNFDPLPYHFTNVALHVLNCVLVFAFIFALCRSLSLSFATAILFGIHPLRVESVAWITERKDVLYAFFFLCALLLYIKWRARRTVSLYILVTFFFILSLLSKPVAIVLPAVLLLCDYYLDGCLRYPHFRQKIPLFVISALALLLSILNGWKYLGADEGFTRVEYLCIGCYAALFYLVKTAIPWGISCMYPYPIKSQGHLPLLFYCAPLGAALVAGLIAWSARYTRKITFGGLFFLITLLPALRMFPPGLIIVADRYTYLPSVGLSFIAAAAILHWLGKRRWPALVALLILAAPLSMLTWQRCKVWSDNLALWDDAVKKGGTRYIPVAYFNRGIVRTDRGAYEKAIGDFSRSLELFCLRKEIIADPAAVCRSPRAAENSVADPGGYPAVYACIAGKYEELGKRTEALGCIYVAWRAWGPSEATRRTLLHELDAWRAREKSAESPSPR